MNMPGSNYYHLKQRQNLGHKGPLPEQKKTTDPKAQETKEKPLSQDSASKPVFEHFPEQKIPIAQVKPLVFDESGNQIGHFKEDKPVITRPHINLPSDRFRSDSYKELYSAVKTYNKDRSNKATEKMIEAFKGWAEKKCNNDGELSKSDKTAMKVMLEALKTMGGSKAVIEFLSKMPLASTKTTGETTKNYLKAELLKEQVLQFETTIKDHVMTAPNDQLRNQNTLKSFETTQASLQAELKGANFNFSEKSVLETQVNNMQTCIDAIKTGGKIDKKYFSEKSAHTVLIMPSGKRLELMIIFSKKEAQSFNEKGVEVEKGKDIIGKGAYGGVVYGRELGTSNIAAIKIIKGADSIKLSEGELNTPKSEATQGFTQKDGKDVPTMYLVMEYIKGPDLDKFLKEASAPDSKGLTDKAVKNLLVSFLKNVDDLHKDHLIHRDLKPGNAILTSTGDVKLIDFGTSKKMKSENQEKLKEFDIGSPMYAAPEVLKLGVGGSEANNEEFDPMAEGDDSTDFDPTDSMVVKDDDSDFERSDSIVARDDDSDSERSDSMVPSRNRSNALPRDLESKQPASESKTNRMGLMKAYDGYKADDFSAGMTCLEILFTLSNKNKVFCPELRSSGDIQNVKTREASLKKAINALPEKFESYKVLLGGPDYASQDKPLGGLLSFNDETRGSVSQALQVLTQGPVLQ